MSVGPRSAASSAPSTRGGSHSVPRPKVSVSTFMSGGGGTSEVHPPAYPVWKGTSRPGPVLDTARPGRAGSKNAASWTPSTSSESSSSAIRSAMRRLVLARRLSLMTPAGRCVARMRCRPSERPRWATSTTPSTNSGTSCDEGGELVDDDDERRRGVDLAAALELDEVLGLVPGEQVLAVVQLGRERRERAAHEVRRQVGDEADGVRQLDAVAEGGAALVVDEQERDPVRRVRGGHAEDPRLQELGLAGAGRAADEGVRAVGAEVDRERALARLADDGAQVAGLARQHGRGIRAGEDRARLAPLLDDGLLGARRGRCRRG